MNALEERLVNELTRQSDGIPTARGDAARVRKNGRRRLLARRTGVTISAAVVVVIALMPIAFMYGTATESGPAGGASVAPPITDSSATTSVPVLEPDAPDPPSFGMVTGDWSVMEAVDGESGTVLIYEGGPRRRTGKAGEPQLTISVWSNSAELIADEEVGYQNSLAYLIANEQSLGDVTVFSNTVARAFTFTDSSTGISGFNFLWQHSETVAVHVIVYVDSFDQAMSLVSSVEQLSERGWRVIVDGQEIFGTTVAPTTIARSEG